MITLREGDSREVLRQMIERGEMVDSVVCDPPYGLKSVVKRFGKEGYKPAKFGRDGAFSRASRGFMGMTWDGTDIENDPEFWGLVYQVLKPGGYIVAFSSSRTYHLMATAIETAGFVTHPMIGWVYSSGMPKAHNAAMAIDKALGIEGERIALGNPVRRIRPGADQNKDGTWEKLEGREYQPGTYASASAEAQRWQGWSYGGQARKPALEPIYVGQKPFSEKNGALNLLKHGVGAVNIDGVRVPSEGGKHREGEASQSRDYRESGSTNFAMKPGPRGGDPKGRWPANLIHDGSAEVVALFPESAGARAPVKGTEPSKPTKDIYGQFAGRVPFTPHGDSGSAARFFESYPYLCPECSDEGWVVEGEGTEMIQVSCPSCAGSCNDPSPFDGNPFVYHAKANKKDRAGSRHATVKPIGLMRALVRHVTPPGGITLDPFAGSGSTGQAALEEGVGAILIEREVEYCRDIRRRLGIHDSVTNVLTNYLAVLGFRGQAG